MPVAAPDADVENQIDKVYDELTSLRDILRHADLDATPFYYQVIEFITYLEDLQTEDFV